jgi:hypothetical protein
VLLVPAPGEPTAGPWWDAPVSELVSLVMSVGSGVRGRPMIVAVDGRSGGGKSTLAAKLQIAGPRSAIVHTDDIAWHHSLFGWAELLATGVLEPVRAGRAVAYRPPPWDERGRPGAVEVPGGLELLIVEGVGAGQRDLTPLLDALIWVQSDHAEAERRGLARDIDSGVNGDEEASRAFWQSWMAEELPFVAQQRPWERADVIVAGTRPGEDEPDRVTLGQPVVRARTVRPAAAARHRRRGQTQWTMLEMETGS